MNASPFILFGNLHLITMALIIFTAVFLPLTCKNLSDSSKSLTSKIIAFIILSHVIISPFKDLYLLENPYHWKEIIPLHMCDLSEIFLASFLLGGPKILYKCAFFWGLAGASMAIITPDIPVVDLDYAFFMIGHGMIVIGVMYDLKTSVKQKILQVVVLNYNVSNLFVHSVILPLMKLDVVSHLETLKN